MATRASSGVRVVPVPGLNFEPVDTTPEEAAELVASGSFVYEKEAPEAPAQAAQAAEVSGDDAGQ